MKLYNYANDYALSERLSASQKKLDPIKGVPEAPVGTEGGEPETKADNQAAKAKKATRKAKGEEEQDKALQV